MASSLEKEIHDLMAAMTPVVSQENCAKALDSFNWKKH